MADALLPALLTRCGFPPPGTEVVCAVSGGADSLALLVLAVAQGLAATAIHVDHGLRAGSAGEASVVKEAAAQLGASFEGRSVAVEPGPNLEARARRFRYAALPAGVLTGHTADDLAETMLVNLLRGAGLDGLAPMRPHGRVVQQVVRPLLGLQPGPRRGRWVPDRPPGWCRSRIRATAIPASPAIGSATNCSHCWARSAGGILFPSWYARRSCWVPRPPSWTTRRRRLDPTDARALAAAPEVLARRAIRAWLRATDDERHPPTAAEVERVLAVARGDAVACQLSGDRRVQRSHGRLTLTHVPAVGTGQVFT